MARRGPILSSLLAIAGCNDGLGDASSATTSPITGVEGSSSTTPDSLPWTTTFSTSANAASTTGTTGTTGGSSSDAEITDGVFTSGGMIPDFGDALGCAGKIDLLFAISSSNTMEDEYPTLVASLPLFLDTIESAWDEFDVHIMSAATSKASTWGDNSCEEQCSLNDGDGCEPVGPADYPCWGYEDNNLDSCDLTFGAGITFPAGFGASNKRCELHGGNRYIIGSDPNLEASFECITHRGYTNAGKTSVVQSLVAALSPELLAPGACNAGFLRDDALLVIVVVVDLYYGGYPVEPDVWASKVLDLKDGDQSSIVVVLLNPDGYDVDDPVCEGPGAGDWVNTPVVDFLEYFDNGIRGSICEPTFAPFFDAAAELVVETCELYAPQ